MKTLLMTIGAFFGSIIVQCIIVRTYDGMFNHAPFDQQADCILMTSFFIAGLTAGLSYRSD
jgi:hypothetical protein